MPGIAAYGAYIPRYRLGPDTDGWNSRSQRAIANFDEDSVTMAVAAGLDCLTGHDRQHIDGLLFATTTPPYAEKGCASIIAAALDLRRDIFTADITDTLRAGATALKQALDSISAGSAAQVLVIAADSRPAAPKGDAERNSGDGAAAFILSRHNIIAQQEGYHAITENMLDVWRSHGDPFLRSWEDRFAIEQGLERILPEAIAGYLQRQNLTPRDISKLALYAPDGRRHAQLAQQLGFTSEQTQDPMFGRLGNTGAAFVPMQLAAALETAAPNQLIIAASYGDGSEIIGFRTTALAAAPGITPAPSNATAPGASTTAPGNPAANGHPRGVTAHLNAGRTLDSYETYARWREVWVTDAASRRPQPQSPSVSALWRESDRNIRFYGAACNQCHFIQYPHQRVCVKCQARDNSTPIRLSDKPAQIFTYSLDYLAGTTDTPLVIAVIDFQGGGRALTMVTDRELDEIQIGTPVTMTFRKLRVVNGIHNYYWKAAPHRTVTIPIGE